MTASLTDMIFSARFRMELADRASESADADGDHFVANTLNREARAHERAWHALRRLSPQQEAAQ